MRTPSHARHTDQVQRVSRRTFIGGGLAALGMALTACGGLSWPGSQAARSINPLGPFDTLDFFIKKHPPGLKGSHSLHQVVDQSLRRSYYLKGDSQRYEVHQWDEQGLYLLLDHDPDRAYSLAPGIWLTRSMSVGDEIVAPATTTITEYEATACRAPRSQPYSYTIKLERFVPDYDAGGDLGRQAVIVIRYLPAGGNAEFFYYSREWGWIAWEEYESTGQLLNISTFNRISSTTLRPAVAPRCQPLLDQG